MLRKLLALAVTLAAVSTADAQVLRFRSRVSLHSSGCQAGVCPAPPPASLPVKPQSSASQIPVKPVTPPTLQAAPVMLPAVACGTSYAHHERHTVRERLGGWVWPLLHKARHPFGGRFSRCG